MKNPVSADVSPANDRFYFPLISQICADKIPEINLRSSAQSAGKCIFARSIRSSPTGVGLNRCFSRMTVPEGASELFFSL
jgi:hypothetical protein